MPSDRRPSEESVVTVTLPYKVALTLFELALSEAVIVERAEIQAATALGSAKYRNAVRALGKVL